MARALLAAFEDADPAARLAFLQALADSFGPGAKVVKSALGALQASPDAPEAMEALHSAAEPRRQELLRRLNLAPGGTAALVRMHEELLRHLRDHPDLRRVDHDFTRLSPHGSTGFLGLRNIDWNNPASILEKIIRYDAVLRSGTGTICATGCNRPTGAATASSTRNGWTSR